MKIIIVEDDASIRTMLEYYFKSMGHQVRAYESGEELFAHEVRGDIALLDVMLPGMDGLEIVRRLRQDPTTAKLPIIMLTARQTEMDKVTALDAGADDYITKPFGVMELQARINAVLRRMGERDPQLVYEDLVIDPAGRTVRRGDEEISLTYKEFELLRLLVSRRGTVLTMDSTEWLACSTVWGSRSSKARIRCNFSPSALRIWARAVCSRATDSIRSETA